MGVRSFRVLLAAAVAAAASACAGDPGGTKVPGAKPTPRAAIAAILPGATLVSDKGAGIIAHNGAGIIGKVKIPSGIIANNGGSLLSDKGVGVISENSSGIIANNGSGLVGKTKYALAQAADDLPLAEATVTITGADGAPINDPAGKPYVARTDRAGAYRFERTPTGRNFLVKVTLPAAVGDMVALLPQARVATELAVDARSTLVMGFIASAFVKGDWSFGEDLDGLSAKLGLRHNW